MLNFKTLRYFLYENCVILTLVVLSQYTRVTDGRQTDRQHIMTIAGHFVQLNIAKFELRNSCLFKDTGR